MDEVETVKLSHLRQHPRDGCDAGGAFSEGRGSADPGEVGDLKEVERFTHEALEPQDECGSEDS
jgi:hypothetical protein